MSKSVISDADLLESAGEATADQTSIVQHDLAPRPVEVDETTWQLDPNSPLHQLFLRRMEETRDLKIIITAQDAETGVGKTTLAAGLALGWHPIYRNEPWTCDEAATIDVPEYLRRYSNLSPGSILLMEEAEQLDSRRSMAGKNVDFSHYWMTMRVRQVVSILTLPTAAALDNRLQQLADVWIDVERRGRAIVHDISVNSYDKKLRTPKKHRIEWPDISAHPEVGALAEMKEEKIDRGLSDIEEAEEESFDKDDMERERVLAFAQALREQGVQVKSNDDETDTILSRIEDRFGVSYSDTYIYNNTEAE